MMALWSPTKWTKPKFIINGYDFRIDVDAVAESELNLVKTKMYSPKTMWGYNDIQFTNFTGETIDAIIYSRTTDVYDGDEAQPVAEERAISGFYKTERTPHAVLKYWAQNFVPCKIVTDLQAFNDGTYIIESIKQKNLEVDFIQTTLEFAMYQKPSEMEQVYWSPVTYNDVKSVSFSTNALAVRDLGYYTQTCTCNQTTPGDLCTATEDADVKFIQKLLQDWGYFPNYSKETGTITPTGKYCWITTQAISKFQETEGIPVTGDFTESTRSAFLRKIMES